LGEEKRLKKCAGEVEKIVPELERPPDHGDDVQDRTRPENQDNEQPGSEVRPKCGLLNRNYVPPVLDQESERDTLDNADERKLDLDNHRVEFSAAGR
jgi:hypothetical protein